MWTKAFITRPEIGAILDRLIKDTGVTAVVVYSHGRPASRWKGKPAEQLASQDAYSVFLRIEEVGDDELVYVASQGEAGGWVIVHLSGIYYDFTRECSVLYSEANKRPEIESSLSIYKSLKKAILKTASIELEWDRPEPPEVKYCSPGSAALYDAGIKLVVGYPDDESRHLRPKVNV